MISEGSNFTLGDFLITHVTQSHISTYFCRLNTISDRAEFSRNEKTVLWIKNTNFADEIKPNIELLKSNKQKKSKKMKNIFYKTLLISLLLCVEQTMQGATTFTVNGIRYYVNNANCVFVASNSGNYSGNISIPSTVTYSKKTYMVTGINPYAFRNCTGLTSVSMPSSIVNIGSEAFSGCVGLTSIKIPKGVYYIGELAFYGCTGLTSFTVDEENDDFTAIDGLLLTKDSTTLVAVPAGIDMGTKVLTIPESVTSIGKYAFDGCTKLIYINLSNKVTSISAYAFRNCKGLQTITLSDSLRSIGSYAFNGCGFTSITIPQNVTSIGNNAFYGCDSLFYIRLCSSELNSAFNFSDSCIVYAHDKAWEKVKAPNAQHGYLVLGDSVGYTYESTLSSIDISFRKFVRHNIKSGVDWRITNSDENFERLSSYYNSECEEYRIDSLLPGKQYVFKNFGLQHYKSGGGIFMNPPATEPFDVYCTTQQPTLSIVTAEATYRTLSVCVFASLIDNDTPSEVGVEYDGHRYSQSENTDFSIITDLKPGQTVNFKPYAIYGDSIYYGEMATYSTKTPSLTYKNVNKGQTWIGVSGITVDEDNELQCKETGLIYGETYYKANNSGYASVTGLFPNKSYGLTIYAQYEDTIIKKYLSAQTATVTPSLNYEITPTTLTVKGSCNLADGLEITWKRVSIGGETSETDEYSVAHLDPNKSYSITYSVRVKGNGQSDSFSTSKSVSTSALTLTTLQPKVVSSTCAIAAATTNISEEETSVGFQWKKYDAPEELEPKEGYSAIYDGQIEGYIKNLQGTYYKVRAFYKSASETYYYGDWVTFDQTDFSYFEPTVHTYNATEVTYNSAKLKGYVLQGTDDVTEQGFEYWKSSGSSANAKLVYAPLATDKVITVLATGQVMTSTLENLQPNTTYTCRAFVKTANGTTYGEEQTFTTEDGVTGIYDVQEDATPKTIIGYYDMQGRKLNDKIKGMNIIRYSDGTASKIYVK